MENTKIATEVFRNSRRISYEKIQFPLNDCGNITVETAWAVGLGNDLYQIKNNLFFFYGVALDDIVKAESLETEEFPIFTKVVNYSGNKLVRVLLDSPVDAEGLDKGFFKILSEMGCSYEGFFKQYLCINIPKTTSIATVCGYLVDNNVLWELGNQEALTYEEVVQVYRMRTKQEQVPA